MNSNLIVAILWLVLAIYLNLLLAKKYRYNKILVIILAVLFGLISTLVLWLWGAFIKGGSRKKSSKRKSKKKR